MEDGTCQDCNGLKVTTVNGRRRIEVPRDFGSSLLGSLDQQTREAMQSAESRVGESPGSIRPEYVAPRTLKGQFTIAHTDASDVFPFQAQQDGGKETFPGVNPGGRGMDSKLKNNIGTVLGADDDVEEKIEEMLKRKVGKCNCTEVKTCWETTLVKLMRIEKNLERADINPPTAMSKDSDIEVKVLVYKYDRYVYKIGMKYTLECTKSAEPEDCAKDWIESGTWEGEVHYDVDHPSTGSGVTDEKKKNPREESETLKKGKEADEKTVNKWRKKHSNEKPKKDDIELKGVNDEGVAVPGAVGEKDCFTSN